MPAALRILFGFSGFIAGVFIWFFGTALSDLERDHFLVRDAPFLFGLVAAAGVMEAAKLRLGYLSAFILGVAALGAIGFLVGLVGIPLVALTLGYELEFFPGSSFILGPVGLLTGGPVGVALFWWWRRPSRRAKS